MMQKDLENVTCKEVSLQTLDFRVSVCLLASNSYMCALLSVLQIRTELEMHMTCNLREFKEFIDNEMIVILGQMDSPTEIFEHVFLVGAAAAAFRPSVFHYTESHMISAARSRLQD